MDFKVDIRRNNLVEFMKYIDTEYKKKLDKRKSDNNFDVIRLFTKKKIAAGVEGEIFLSQTNTHRQFVIKHVNNKKLAKKVVIEEYNPNKLYKSFLTNKAFNLPIFSEIVFQTLTNQLVFQNICPNFSLNWYWEINVKGINIFNEYANLSDFHTWAMQLHSEEEWLNALFQILYAIIAMKRYFNILHTDLHTGNILVNKVNPGGYWVYRIDGHNYYVPNMGYVFLVHDFGFAWIPNKTKPVSWHYEQTLRYICNGGKDVYDFVSLMSWILKYEDYKVPGNFRMKMFQELSKPEFKYIFTKQYYIINKGKYKDKYKSYPNIKSNYRINEKALQDLLHSLFTEFTQKQNNLIESFSLDKPFDKTKLYDNLKKMLRTQ